VINFRKERKHPKNRDLFSNFPTLHKFTAPMLALILLLQGCGDLFEPTIAEICESNSEMCLDLSLDARCLRERAEIIRLRYQHQNDTTDTHKYPLLLAFETYLVCVDKVQHIEHIRHKGKEATRLKGVLTAQREIQRLSRETRSSLDPYLSYYHWSRHGDTNALNRFERYAASDKVNDPELLISLASIQIKSDPNRTINTLYRALSLYQDSDEIDVSIYQTLASLAKDKENHRMAYVWLAVSERFDENIPATQRTRLSMQHTLPVEILDNVTGDIVSALKRGEFDAQALKLYRL